jgi:hypothetical protein
MDRFNESDIIFINVSQIMEELIDKVIICCDKQYDNEQYNVEQNNLTNLVRPNKIIQFTDIDDIYIIPNNEDIQSENIKCDLWWTPSEQKMFKITGFGEIKKYGEKHPTLTYKQLLIKKYKIDLNIDTCVGSNNLTDKTDTISLNSPIKIKRTKNTKNTKKIIEQQKEIEEKETEQKAIEEKAYVDKVNTINTMDKLFNIINKKTKKQKNKRTDVSNILNPIDDTDVIKIKKMQNNIDIEKALISFFGEGKK